MSIRDETVTDLVFVDQTAAGNPTEEGQARRVNDDLVCYLGGTVKSLTAGGGGGGISEAQHNALRQLIHFIDDGPADGFASGAYREVTGGAFPTAVVWYADATKVDKLVELTITRGAGQRPTSEVWEMYDTDGSTVLVTLTDTIVYSGPFEASRTRVWA